MRRATAEDAPAVSALVQGTYQRHVAAMGRRPRPMDEDYSKTLAEAEAWLDEEGGELRALIVLMPRHDHLWVDNVAVRADLRGNGIGKRLLDFAERRARGLGVPELRLLTHETMRENIELYRHLGWEQFEPEDAEPELCYFRRPAKSS